MTSQTKPKVMFFILDGIGDLLLTDTDEKYVDKTPLQVSNIPTMDKLAETGATGMHDSVAAGLACGSDTSHMNIFGSNPFEHYTGRGAFETEGSGLVMEQGDIAFKCNFSYMDPKTRLVHKRRVDREFHHWGLDLIDAVNDIKIPGFEEYKVSAKHATEHRLGLKVSGPGLSYRITDTDPLVDDKKLQIVKAQEPGAVKTAQVVSALSKEIEKVLQNHPINKEREKNGLLPANIICLRGCGIKLKLPSFEETHGMKAFAICPTAIIKGMAMTLQFDILDVEGATGDYHSDFKAKAKAAVKELYDAEKGYEFAFVHMKATDEASHDGDIKIRVDMNERADEMIKTALDLMKEESQDCIIVVTGDHTTPVQLKDHTTECVPFLISSKKAYFNQFIEGEKGFFIKDKVKSYDEVACSDGIFGRFTGHQIMPLIKNLRDNM